MNKFLFLKQELPGINQELSEINFNFKQQLPAIEQQLSAIRSLASGKIYKIYKISLACEQENKKKKIYKIYKIS